MGLKFHKLKSKFRSLFLWLKMQFYQQNIIGTEMLRDLFTNLNELSKFILQTELHHGQKKTPSRVKFLKETK